MQALLAREAPVETEPTPAAELPRKVRTLTALKTHPRTHKPLASTARQSARAWERVRAERVRACARRRACQRRMASLSLMRSARAFSRDSP